MGRYLLNSGGPGTRRRRLLARRRPEVGDVDPNRAQDDPDTRLAWPVRGAEVGPAIFVADAPGEAVIVIRGDLDVAADLQGAVRAGRVGMSRVARGWAMRFLVFCRVVFSEILTRSSSARKATMVL
jgi:hypothetical protein